MGFLSLARPGGFWVEAGLGLHQRFLGLILSVLNIVFVIPFITVAKSKMYYQGVKNTDLGVKAQS